MDQNLRSQLVPVVSVYLYRSQHSPEKPQSNISSAKRSRNRGIILTQRGWQKLMQPGISHDEFGHRYTYEQLSERSLLDKRTVSRLLSCEVKVDKGTLKTFFCAFGLSLEASDHTSSDIDRASNIASNVSTHAALTIQRVEFE